MTDKKTWFITGGGRGMGTDMEGWMESLAAEAGPFAITTTIVNPGF